MDNIVIGQYIPSDSLIHKMDPRIKIVALILLIVSVFLAPSILYVSIIFVFIATLLLISRVPLRKALHGIKGLAFLLAFTAVLQIGYTTTGPLLLSHTTLYVTWYNILITVGLLILYIFTKKFIPCKLLYLLLIVCASVALQYHFIVGTLVFKYQIRIYEGGLIRAGFIFIRVINVVLLSSLLTFTTSPTDLNNGLESLLKPLKKIKVPVGEIAMMLSLVLRFIPTLLDESNKIMKAQASRGADFKESHLIKKIRQIISLLVPMFVVSFQRAEDLANAMESRGYVIGEERTKIDLMTIHKVDIFALVSVMILLGIMIWSCVAL